MIKATAGGGGRGMRLAMEEGDFMRLLQQAQQEADAAFGNPDMYLERYVKNPRHIEFQVLCFCSPYQHWGFAMSMLVSSSSVSMGLFNSSHMSVIVVWSICYLDNLMSLCEAAEH